jgi:hypothetical protein
MTVVTTPEMTSVAGERDDDLHDRVWSIPLAVEEEAADEVDADDVERVVVAEAELQADGRRRHAGDAADEDRAERADRASGRGDRHEAGDDAEAAPSEVA